MPKILADPVKKNFQQIDYQLNTCTQPYKSGKMDLLYPTNSLINS